MLIVIGSKSPPKIEAVTRTLIGYPELFRARKSDPESLQAFSLEVPTGVSAQPGSLEETVLGARNRAKSAMNAFDAEQQARCVDLAFGIESGMLRIPGDRGTPFEFSACAIYDGTDMHVGLSPAFRIPPEVYRHVEAGANLSEATRLAGLTKHEYVGSAEGIIGILTRGRVTRMQYTAMAVHMALANLR